MDPTVLGDPVAAVEQLQGRVGAGLRVEVSAIIEIVEGLCRAEKGSEGRIVRRPGAGTQRQTPRSFA